MKVGGVVSTTVTVWLQKAMLLQVSVAFQVRVALKVQPEALVTVLKMVMVTPPQLSVALGGSNVHGSPH